MLSSEFYTALGMFATGLLTVIATVWSLAWWFEGRFSAMKTSFYDRLEKMEVNILNKLEYHERHDDKRFADIRDDIWNIRVATAAKYGLGNARIRKTLENNDDNH